MQKKYLKYILLSFVVFFGFNFEAFAKAEIIDKKVTEIQKNKCSYNVNGYNLTFYQQIDRLNLVKDEKNGNYTKVSVNFTSNDYSKFSGNSCPYIQFYSKQWHDSMTNEKGNELYIWVEGNVPDDIANGTDKNYKYLGKTQGTYSKFVIACKYDIESGSFMAELDMNSKKISTKISITSPFETYNQKSSTKKNWKYTENGIVCRDDIALDSCPYYDEINVEKKYSFNVRTTADKMAPTCTKSTYSGGINITEKDEANSGTKMLYLSDICEESANTLKVIRFIGYLLVIVKILIPIGLIATGIISFSKAIIAGNEDTMKSTITSFAWKIVIAIVVFILPTIINFIIAKIDGASDGTEDYANCRNCIFNPKECSIPEE